MIEASESWASQKRLAAELFTKKKNGETETKRALDYLRMPKLS